MNNTDYNLILVDLLNTVPTNPVIPPRPADNYQDIQERIMKTYRRLLRTRTIMRKHQLVYAYYLGELLEQYPEERRISRRKISQYYYSVSIRTYNIFEGIGVDQIFRTNNTTLAKIARLSANDYQALI
ncbi:15222_t:CDS:1 [Dentiscutata heterogama]|uniref:15222_t:CDS:1 n=1 Tax=Dentiscutata heterogama TaxID=1316150 RepID=A0ACA9LS95_9GLOM|nr:15222_t:CDS:1 [Dentiscutata heterogama]